MAKLTQQQLETHLWGAANIFRGKTAGQDYKNYILSLMFYKRLCDQWENEADEAIAEQERQQGRKFTEEQKQIFRARGEHRFNIPEGSRWSDVKQAGTNLGEVLTTAMRAVANANDELRGVFTVDWNQPAPDGSGKPLIPNEVVHALIQHFDEHNLSNESVCHRTSWVALTNISSSNSPTTPAPRQGSSLHRRRSWTHSSVSLSPNPGILSMIRRAAAAECSSIRPTICANRVITQRARDTSRQEMNWGNAAIGKINSVLHGLEADIKAGTSTITDPQFLENGQVKKFSVVLANFPFSDEFWWLKPEQQTDDKKKKDKLKKEIFGKEGYKDPFGRFGRGASFKAPPAAYGDYAFILHIVASLADDGRAGIVCPQGVLFRGQPEVEEETGEFDDDGNPIVKRRKADDEHLIREALLQSRVIDAVISLPLNVFYGAGVPACLLILRKQRPTKRRDKVLLVYAARHFRALSAQNELRPQDVMRILVHYHAYGDSEKVTELVAKHSGRIREQIRLREEDEVGRLDVEYQTHAERLVKFTEELATARTKFAEATKKAERDRAEATVTRLEKQREKVAAKIVERDERIAEARRRAEEDRQDVIKVGEELAALYTDPDELLKHARVVSIEEVEENEFNLNIPRYVDTFEPEQCIEVKDAVKALRDAESEVQRAEEELTALLRNIGYGR